MITDYGLEYENIAASFAETRTPRAYATNQNQFAVYGLSLETP